MAADAERFLHQISGAGSQPLDSAGWLQRAGSNIRKASDAQHLEAIALAYATYVQVSASPLRDTIVAELETLSGRKRSRTTLDLHLIVERFVSYGGECQKALERGSSAFSVLAGGSGVDQRCGPRAARCRSPTRRCRRSRTVFTSMI